MVENNQVTLAHGRCGDVRMEYLGAGDVGDGRDSRCEKAVESAG